METSMRGEGSANMISVISKGDQQAAIKRDMNMKLRMNFNINQHSPSIASTFQHRMAGVFSIHFKHFLLLGCRCT
jgi:hypothetical protein